MKKMISLFLAILFVLPVIVSCNDNTPATSDTTTTAETTTVPAGVIEEIEPIVIIDSNEAYFELVRPDNDVDIQKELMQNIILSIQQRSGGLRLKAAVDWVMPDTDTSQNHEILMGYTERDETKTVMDSIGYDDFAIRAVGNKIVIAAHRRQRLIEAVNYFLKNLVEVKKSDDGAVSVIYKGNYLMKSDKEYIINDENPLSGYTVVCDKSIANCNKAATELVDKIKKFADIELPINDVSDPEVECEIIVGKNSRDASKQILIENESVTDLDYVIGSVGKKIVIGSRYDYMTYIGVQGFVKNYLDRNFTYSLNVAVNELEINSAYRFEEDATEAEGTDIRVMSYNILSEEWAEEAKILDGRDTASVSAIMYFAPDVVGLQEVSANWYRRIDRLFGDKYKIVDRLNTKNETNYSPLAYNTEKVKVIEHGVKIYSKGNSSKLRLMSWGLFETLDTGKQFIVINTHWDLSKNDDKGYRTTHSKEMAAYALELEAKYNCPVITTGDYNASESESMYTNFVKTTGFHEAKHTAKVVNLACKTTHTLGSAVSTAKANSIDHIFGSEKVEFLYFDVLVNKIVTDASDHNPIYADIKLK